MDYLPDCLWEIILFMCLKPETTHWDIEEDEKPVETSQLHVRRDRAEQLKVPKEDDKDKEKSLSNLPLTDSIQSIKYHELQDGHGEATYNYFSMVRVCRKWRRIIQEPTLHFVFIPWLESNKNTVFWVYVCLDGDIRRASVFLRKEMDIKIDYEDLIYHYCKDVSLMRMILRTGRVQLNSSTGNDLIMNAVSENNVSMVRFFLGQQDDESHDPTWLSLEEDRELVKHIDPSFNSDQALRNACNYGYVEIVQMLLKDPRVNPASKNYSAFLLACLVRKENNGDGCDVIRLLLQDPRSLPPLTGSSSSKELPMIIHHHYDYTSSTEDQMYRLFKHMMIGECKEEEEEHSSGLQQKQPYPYGPGEFLERCIIAACMENNYEIVELLIQDPRVNTDNLYRNTDGSPVELHSHLVYRAILRDYIKVAEILLKYTNVDPSGYDNEFIRSACARGSVEFTKLLLADPRVDPSANKNDPLFAACMNSSDNVQLVDLLLEDPRLRLPPCTFLSYIPASFNITVNSFVMLAVSCGNSGVTLRLLQDDRIGSCVATRNYALRWSCANGLISIVSLVLMISDNECKKRRMQNTINGTDLDENNNNEHQMLNGRTVTDRFTGGYLERLAYVIGKHGDIKTAWSAHDNTELLQLLKDHDTMSQEHLSKHDHIITTWSMKNNTEFHTKEV